MKIAYITNTDPTDLHSWSGLTYYISQALEKAKNEIIYIQVASPKVGPILKLKQKLYPKITGKFIQPNRYPSFYNQYSASIKNALKNLSNVDFLFSDSSELIALASGNLPKAFWVDASFAGIVNYYQEFSLLHKQTIRQGNKLEQKAYDNATLVFFASEWAASTARANYKIDEAKIKIVPFGANLSGIPTESEIKKVIKNKQIETCKLLFSGVDWNRKGGPLALEITEKLNKSEIKTQLIISGCKPFTAGTEPSYVKQIGFLSKKNPEQKKIYETLFNEAHFLLVPSQAECYGLVYCEANAYGLPALATKTGGIPTIIKDEVNGKTFELNASVDEYVSFIKKYFLDANLYQDLSYKSYQAYTNNLNWDVAGKKVSKILSEHTIG
ncbi:glycosyltransferase family 4 protein [Pedobacter fastidiosus]|uniref:Glycosyltransferase family 4 protein n=1 Tax=Pedobacter fastidiosus TaxID=2765361 RepID=A0ABR7KVN0_9SPHI|nr:glycosyltransferase family 4 protein [Pedobacter fastidiosus]MBC6112170.1 glycosyltransferase family 4 protein [Pedobacter fastidiosus]